MSEPSNIIPFKQTNGLTISLRADLVLKRQGKKDVIKCITILIQRLASLYSVPDWTDVKSVDLAEWIYDNYTFELMEVVDRVLRNPPKLDKQIWRLTPDVIRDWMTVELEKQCEVRERQNNEYKKLERGNLPSELINEVLHESDDLEKEEVKEKNGLRRLAAWLKNTVK